MVDSGAFSRQFLYGILLIVSRLAGAIVAVVALYFCMWLYDAPTADAYHVLAIIVALLALLLFPGAPVNDVRPGPNFWSNSVSVIGRWFILVGVLLILAYATKMSAVYSRKLLFSWMLITPPLIAVAKTMLNLYIARVRLRSRGRRSFVVVGANNLGVTVANKIGVHFCSIPMNNISPVTMNPLFIKRLLK